MNLVIHRVKSSDPSINFLVKHDGVNKFEVSGIKINKKKRPDVSEIVSQKNTVVLMDFDGQVYQFKNDQISKSEWLAHLGWVDANGDAHVIEMVQ